MTQAQHTPGPWRLEDWVYQDGKRHVPTIQNDSDAIAQVLDLWCMDNRTAERDANARLIAAAPELLAALEAIAAISDPKSGDRGPTRRARHIAECALAKARGEG